MTKNEHKQTEQQLLTAITARQKAGDAAGEAELRGRLGWFYSQQQQWGQAAGQFEAARLLAEAAGETAVAAHFRYAEALALYQAPDQRAEAATRLADAAQRFATDETITNPAALSAVRQRQAFVAFQQGDGTTALEAMHQAMEAAPDSPAFRAELHLNRAIFAWLEADYEQATTDIDQARALAGGLDNEALQQRVETVYQMFFGPQPGVTATADPIQQLLQQVEAQAGDDRLAQAAEALAHNELAQALTQAQRAKTAALEATDPTRYLRYLSASLLLALIYERRGEDAAVIETLLTAKKSLERPLGQTVGRQIGYLLDSLYDRWGQARFEAALAAYRAGVNKA
jgi:tetratricopeptide (TPR) repeat protein